MSDPDLVGLRKIAEAALAEWHVNEPSMVLRRFHEATAPARVLALLDRIEELERAISEIPKHCGGSFTAADGYTSVAVADGEAIKEILEGVNHDDK